VFLSPSAVHEVIQTTAISGPIESNWFGIWPVVEDLEETEGRDSPDFNDTHTHPPVEPCDVD
jgi:hypothetical protein